MFYNKHNIAIAKIVEKVPGHTPRFRAVYFMPDRTMATDAFRLMEITTPKQTENAITKGIAITDTDGPIAVTPEALENIDMKKASEMYPYMYFSKLAKDTTTMELYTGGEGGIIKVDSSRQHEEMPKYQEILKGAEERKSCTIHVNGKYLADLVKILNDLGDNAGIDISVPLEDTQRKPLMITARNTGTGQVGKALLMPIVK